MDTLAHGLWGGLLAGWRKRFCLAFLFGVCPDLFSFGLWMLIRFIQGTFSRGRPPVYMIPDWLNTAYNYTHSLVIALAVWAFLWWWKRDLAVPFSAWIIHILFDIPTHSNAFFPTPFLFPLSRYTFNGFSWGQQWFMILNYSCLLAVALLWIVSRRRRELGSLSGVNRKGQGEEPPPGGRERSMRSA
ncbi:MAG: hypothetical protein U9N45_01465 [Gemmatimonadota bacterium]|nr:hypothetical protein [Gemmatimonadota bacterium]